MKAKQYTVAAGLMCLALGACSDMDRNSRSTSSTSGAMNDQGARYDASAGPGSGAATAGAVNRSGANSGTDMANSGDSMTGGSSTAGNTSSSGGMSNATASTSSATDTNSSSASAMYGVVATIDAVPRSQAGDMTSNSGATQSGTSGTSGSTGSANDMVYRISVRLDDGSSRSVYQETLPAYQIGDRVRLSNGALQRY